MPDDPELVTGRNGTLRPAPKTLGAVWCCLVPVRPVSTRPPSATVATVKQEPASDAPAVNPAPAPEPHPAPPAKGELTPTPKPAPPPASTTVLEGELTERELKLQQQLAAEQAAREQAEADADLLANEADQLRAQVNELQTNPRRVRRFMGFTQELD